MPEPSRLEIKRKELCVGEVDDHCSSAQVCCPSCGHRGRVNTKLLLERWGPAARMRDLTSRYRCTRCDTRVAFFSYRFKDYVVLR